LLEDRSGIPDALLGSEAAPRMTRDQEFCDAHAGSTRIDYSLDGVIATEGTEFFGRAETNRRGSDTGSSAHATQHPGQFQDFIDLGPAN
jgi:hypothetical protein